MTTSNQTRSSNNRNQINSTQLRNCRDEDNQESSQKLINLANDVLAAFNNAERLFIYDNHYHNPELKRLAKLEKKFRKSGLTSGDIADHLKEFCIPFEYIPEHLYILMHRIGWLDTDTYAPKPYLTGFYASSYHDYKYDERATKTWHYCTIERYIDLMFIHLDLANIFNKGSAK